MQDFSRLDTIAHHPAIEQITDILCNRTQNLDKPFFQIEVAYFLAKMAGTMNASISTETHGNIPINCYAIALATSGYGKGHSIHIIENQILDAFEKQFMEITFPDSAELCCNNFANKRAVLSGKNLDEERQAIQKEFAQAGAYAFSFDSATVPAVKQLRNKILLAGCGAINLQIDEIGSNLVSSTEVLNAFLELYDQGMIKQKITKSTNENIRSQELKGKTPTNALLFGTPAKLFDGSLVEDQFFSMLETGFARRSLFAWGKYKKIINDKSAISIYNDLINPNNNLNLGKWRDLFEDLADIDNLNRQIKAPQDVMVKCIEYKLLCQKRSEEFPEHANIQKAEMDHRHFKALKLAGSFAFVDNADEISFEDHYLPAIKLVEESGEAFKKIIDRDKNYVKLAKYLAESTNELTHADMNENLPFYKSSSTARNEMMAMAQAWGIKNSIVIKKSVVDGIEFFSGSTLQKTDPNKLLISYSTQMADNYKPVNIRLNQLNKLAVKEGGNWCNHTFLDDHREEANVIPKFNILVLDVDEGTNMYFVHNLFKEYAHCIYTTKRHTEEAHRFRVMVPIDYNLEMTSEEYKEFMQNIDSWLPFKIDRASYQRSKKWLTNPNAQVLLNTEGDLFDILKFIPKTSKNDLLKESLAKLESFDELERWFAKEMTAGNRNNMLHRYGMALLDTGAPIASILEKISTFNSKLSNPLSDNEIRSTVFRTVSAKYTERNP